MKRCILALVVLVLFALPVSAGKPQPPQPCGPGARTAESILFAFPAPVEAALVPAGGPLAPARLDVSGPGWGFSLVQRRWGWEMDTVSCRSDAQQALLLATLDYLNGQPDALRIFPTAPTDFVSLLDSLLS